MSAANELENSIEWNGAHFPKSPRNSMYRRLMAAVDAGEATLNAYTPPPALTAKELDDKAKYDAQRAGISYLNRNGFPPEILTSLLNHKLKAVVAGQSMGSKFNELETWIEAVQVEGIANYAAPNFEKYGKPPYSFREVIMEPLVQP